MMSAALDRKPHWRPATIAVGACTTAVTMTTCQSVVKWVSAGIFLPQLIKPTSELTPYFVVSFLFSWENAAGKRFLYKYIHSFIHSNVRPLLEYCTPVWSLQYRQLIDKVEKVQRRFTKRIRKLRRLPYSDRLQALGHRSLEHRRAN